MTPLLFVGAALAGGVGAVLRYLLDQAISTAVGRRFPWGIVIVNITGSFALGLVTTALPDQAFLLGAGLLGGYTTFSTASFESVRLAQQHRYRAATLHAVAGLLLPVGGAAAGLLLAS